MIGEYQIPWVRLKYLAYVEMGQSPSSEEYSFSSDEDVMPFLQGTADFTDLYPKPQVYCSTPAKVALPEDILFSVRAPVGELNLADQHYGIGRGLCAIRVGQKLNRNFAWWALHWVRNDLNTEATGSTYEAVTAEDVSNLRFPCPELSEQQIIANFLDKEIARLDILFDEKKQLLALLAEKRHALITHSVTKGLIAGVQLQDSGLPWLGEIPEHWRIERAKYLFKQSSLPVREEDEMVTCFRDGQVTLRKNRREEGFTNAILELGYQGIRAGQLVLHSMDAFAGAIGVSDSDGKCSPEYIVCDPANEEIVNDYYGYLLRTMALSGFIQASCPAVRERAPRIRFNDFGEMFFPVPPSDEQRAIVEHIETETKKLDDLRAETQHTIGLLQERRAALIAAAVTGQLNVGVQA